MIPGLSLFLDVIDAEDESTIIQELDQHEWSKSLKRRTQHYGYYYDYTNGSTNRKAPEFPQSVKWIAKFIEENQIMDAPELNHLAKAPEQCIVNEYYRNQGIGKHIDSPKFGPVIVSLSLGADTNFIFRGEGKSVVVEVPRRSLMVLRGEARSKYTHEIPCKTTMEWKGQMVEKSGDYRRVSLTFRTMNK